MTALEKHIHLLGQRALRLDCYTFMVGATDTLFRRIVHIDSDRIVLFHETLCDARDYGPDALEVMRREDYDGIPDFSDSATEALLVAIFDAVVNRNHCSLESSNDQWAVVVWGGDSPVWATDFCDTLAEAIICFFEYQQDLRDA